MNFARLIVLGIAIVAAGMAAFLVRSMSTSQGPAVAAQQEQVRLEMTQVLVATRAIAVGETTVEQDFKWQDWPVAAVHQSFVTYAEGVNKKTEWVGTVLRSPVVDGEPVTGHKLVRIGSGGLMSTILEPGKRGVSIKISAASGAGGFILPNDRVDIVLTHQPKAVGGKAGQFVSETMLKDIRVLAIDQTLREQDGQRVVVGRTATLELTPEQVEELAIAGKSGSLSLSLRSLADVGGIENENGPKKRKSNQQIIVVRNGRLSGS